MSDSPGPGFVNPEDLFYMNPGEFMDTWGLTEDELRRECMTRRLVAHGVKVSTGYNDVRFYLPAIRNWVARKRKMPPAIRAKVEKAGGLDRVDQFRGEQIYRCRIDIEANTLTLPNGDVLRNIHVRRTPQH